MKSRISPTLAALQGVRVPMNHSLLKKSDKISMTREEIEKIVTQNFEDKYDEVYENIREDITAQAIAIFLYAKHKFYGYQNKRLERELEDIESVFKLTEEGVFGKTFTTSDILDYMETKFNLNIQERVKNQK